MLTIHRVMELLSYDPVTGEFRWLNRRANNVLAGDLAGSFDASGYRRIFIDGRNYKAHRLAWLLTHSVWPVYEIDHINRNRADNRIANLRDVPHGVNMVDRVYIKKPGRKPKHAASRLKGTTR